MEVENHKIEPIQPRGLVVCPDCNALSPPFVRFCGECEAPLFPEIREAA